MIVVVPGSGPWVMLPDGNLLLCPLGADGSHFSLHGLLLCLLCAQWTGLVTLVRKRQHVGGRRSWDCQSGWPIGGRGAFRSPWERWKPGREESTAVRWALRSPLNSCYSLYVVHS